MRNINQEVNKLKEKAKKQRNSSIGKGKMKKSYPILKYILYNWIIINKGDRMGGRI